MAVGGFLGGAVAAVIFQLVASSRTADYSLRWINKCGEEGPWSEIATATVAA